MGRGPRDNTAGAALQSWGFLHDRWLAGLLGLLVFLLYLRTTAPSLVALFDDTLEFQLVLPTFGIAHPTGYPLYTLVGGLWSHLLLAGNWAWRVNLFSAAAAAAAAAVLSMAAMTLLRAEGLRGPRWGGAAAAATFALGPVWWQQATVAEVYALHNLLVALILQRAFSLDFASPIRRNRQLALLLALVGFGLTHHRTTLLLAPGLAVYLVWRQPALLRPQRVWLLWLAALLAPLLLYGYLPWRFAQGVSDLHGSYLPTWNGFWAHVLATQYGSFFSANELSRSYSALHWLQHWVAQGGWVGSLLSLLGLASLIRTRCWPAWSLVLLVLAANLLFTLVYQVGDPEVFLLPALLAAALLAGRGLAAVHQLLAGRLASWQAGLAAAGVLLVVVGGAGRGAPVDRSADWALHDYAADLAAVAFPPQSLVIGLEGEMTALRYMQQAEGRGLAATPVVADAPELRRARLAEAVAAGKPVYLTREVEGIETLYSFSGEGPLIRVWPRGASPAVPPTTRTDLLLLDGQLLLEGYDLSRLDWRSGAVLRVVLHWYPLAPLDLDLKVSLRVVDSQQKVLTLADGTPAVNDASPLRQVARTPAWAPETPVRDVYEVRLPTADTDVHLLLILYDAHTLQEVGRLQGALP